MFNVYAIVNVNEVLPGIWNFQSIIFRDALEIEFRSA